MKWDHEPANKAVERDGTSALIRFYEVSTLSEGNVHLGAQC